MDSFERSLHGRRRKKLMDIRERVFGSQTLDGNPSGPVERHSKTSRRLRIGSRIPRILDALHQTDAKTDPCVGYSGRKIQYDLVLANRKGCAPVYPLERTVGLGPPAPRLEIDEPSWDEQVHRVGGDGIARGG